MSITGKIDCDTIHHLYPGTGTTVEASQAGARRFSNIEAYRIFWHLPSGYNTS